MSHLAVNLSTIYPFHSRVEASSTPPAMYQALGWVLLAAHVP